MNNIYLQQSNWDSLYTYLFIDKKLSTSKNSVQPTMSRFKILTKYFSTIPFNRANFNEFIFLYKKNGYSDAYLNNFIKLAKHIDKFLKLNELQDYTYFKKTHNFVDIFTPEQIQLIAELKIDYYRNKEETNKKYKTIYYFLGLTGCRVGELLSLKWEDFNDDSVIFRGTKNGDERVVPVPKFLSNLIQALPKTSNLVFNIEDKSAINGDIKRRCKILNIKKEKLSCHIFRHSFITTMLKQNQASVMQIARIVGHRDLQSTQIYTHLLVEDLRLVQSLHPLCRGKETFESMSDRIKTMVSKSIDPDKFNILTKEENGKLTIEVVGNNTPLT